MLKRLVSLPVSDVIPELDLGGSLGAPCDLQFVVSQVIERSKAGTNIVQMLTAAMHLLVEVESFFQGQLDGVSQKAPAFEALSDDQRAMVVGIIGLHLKACQNCLASLESLFQGGCTTYYEARARYLMQGPLKGRRISLAEFRSHLLISDELIASLDLEREAIDRYFTNSNSNITPFQT
jgi:hypothetical protein